MNEIFGYVFRDPSLLETALTTPSFRQTTPDAEDNQRLEFLGDAVLGFLAADRLYAERPDEHEGSLTVRRTHMVSSAALCAVAASHGLAPLLRRNRGAQPLPSNAKVFADAIEAVIGAAYLDGGIKAAGTIFDNLGLVEKARENPWAGNSKGELQVRCQAMTPHRMPVYEVVDVAGRAHEPRFTVRVTVDGIGEATAMAGSRREAASLAAAKLLERMSS